MWPDAVDCRFQKVELAVVHQRLSAGEGERHVVVGGDEVDVVRGMQLQRGVRVAIDGGVDDSAADLRREWGDVRPSAGQIKANGGAAAERQDGTLFLLLHV